MNLIVFISLLVLGLNAGDNTEGQGCADDSSCIEGLKCKLGRDGLGIYACRSVSGSDSASSPESPPAAQPNESKSGEGGSSVDIFKVVKDTLENFGNLAKTPQK